jgi:hypothetical protein
MGALGGAFGADQTIPYNSYICYFAGVELLSSGTTFSAKDKADRYRRLCEVTGVNGAAAKAFAITYRSDPAGWQKFQSAVLEILQKKK